MNRTVSSFAVPRPDPGRHDGQTAFRRWLVALCTVRFDLEQGQLIEDCFPAGALSSEEELDIAFNSFPDSVSQNQNRASIYDSVFFFRIRRRGSMTLSPSNLRRLSSLPVSSNGYGDSSDNSPSQSLENGSYTGRKSGDGSPVLRDGSPPLPGQDSAQLGHLKDQGLPQRTVSNGSGTLLKDDLAAPGDGGGGIWGGIPMQNLIASMLSPRARPAESGNASLLESQRGSNSWSSPSSASMLSPRARPAVESGNASLLESQRGSNSGSSPSAQKERANGSLSSRVPGSGGQRYLYGFVFNRQRQDERLKRGGEQKSVVVLSERPYSCVFRPLVQIVGPLYFDIGFKALEQVASFVSQWPAPIHGQPMELSISNVTIRAHLPPAHTLPPGCGTVMDDFTAAMAPAAPLYKSVPQGVFHETDVFGMFRGVLMQLWVLWELLLVGEPLLVVAPTPSQCCEAVAGLVGLVAPLPCSVDFRPYFTIHDPDFASLNSLKEGDPIPPMLLGVTNLFFLKALRTLPHVISVGSTLSAPNRYKLVTRSNSQKNMQAHLQLQVQISPFRRFSPTNLLKVARVKKDGPLSLMSEHKEALWTNFAAVTKPDTAVLNRLVDTGLTPQTEESMSIVNNEILRRHFVELTTNFLSPFGPYLRASMPQEGASPFADPPSLPSFDAHEFLESMAARGSGKFLAKRLRGNWLDLYRRFLNGPNFMPWFQRRRAVAEQEQHRLWRQARAKADVRGFLAKMTEIEVIDSFSAIERHLIHELQLVHRAGLGHSEGPICQKLRSDLRAIYNALPKDMQQMLLFHPQRAALLQGGRELTKLPGRASFRIQSSDSFRKQF